ncbi:uncharacterized protein KY384_000420 [Bacidia gigantensis]|uniref:uncharacterized protein n=1 Tax=Bacidia gigantensis TaxID=2732470 RepID=UPI001D039427|nr:uncharacterized protein KY384_000420 [Bacidia gigantensis]KAG8525660.1 hypothetical protein KY384_000420 [Bacidia gigantensis]
MGEGNVWQKCNVGAFGLSPTILGTPDVLPLVLKAAKVTVQNCRHAPDDFSEASNVSQGLCVLLKGVATELKNPKSPLRKDDRVAKEFAVHFKNCQTSLEPLSDLISKHKSLATPNKRLIDRLRFSKKDYLEYRGNLAFYTAQLSEFLHTVGLGSLGRIEQNVEDIKDFLPDLMIKIDQMFAEVRLTEDKESYLSDYTDDEKFVWKAFRSKLNKAGFTSRVLQEHESAIFLRIEELSECGLLDASGSLRTCSEDEVLSPMLTSQPRPSSIADDKSDSDAETIISPAAGKVDNAHQPVDEETMTSNENLPIGAEQERNDITHIKTSLSGVTEDYTNADHVFVPSPLPESPLARVWQDSKGRNIEKGVLNGTEIVNNELFVIIVDRDGHKFSIPRLNLCKNDLAYVDKAMSSNSTQQSHTTNSDPKKSSESAHRGKASKSLYIPSEDPTELPQRTRPEILIGKRTKSDIIWKYRRPGHERPSPAPHRPRHLLTNDALPEAAAEGDLRQVRRLLGLGEHIESRGPKSWTESFQTRDSDGNPVTEQKRHSFLETTALYRAASAGWLDVVHLLLRRGADVDTRNRYDGKPGDPVLFQVVSSGQVEIARLLLEYGARLIRCRNRTALHLASSQPKLSIVQLVLDYGASINPKDSLKQTPLYLATCRGFTSIVQLLLEEGAGRDTLTLKGQSAIYKAAGHVRSDIVRLLLQYGADPSMGRGRYGETAIYKAAWYNGLETVDLFLAFEADVNIPNNEKMEKYNGLGEKVLHGVLGGLAKDHAVMNTWGKTALHAAAYQGHTEMQTALYLAASQKRERAMQALLKAGAKLETEKHDPVLSLINERRKRRELGSKEIQQRQRLDVAKLGTSDPLVALVANFTKMWSESRRARTT